MLQSTSSKRSLREELGTNDTYPSGSKVYIIKIVTDKHNELQLKLKPNDSYVRNASNEVIRLQSCPSQSSQAGQIKELSEPDDSLQTEEVVDLHSFSDDDEHDIEPSNDSEFLLINDEYESEVSQQQSELSDDTLQLDTGTELNQFRTNADLQSTSQILGEADEIVSISNKNRVKRTRNINKKLSFTTKKFSGWTANRHKLKFQQKWITEFPFIEYDSKNNLMFCKACRKYVNDWRKTSPFVVGTDNFRASMLKYHQRSSMHTECQELADTLTSEDSGAMEKDLYKDQLSHVFKSVYFIFKNKMPYTHYPQLCESQKREGTDFSVYTSHLKVVPLFGKFIGMAFEKELAKKLSSLSEFSLIIDASFRRNIESHDLVYLKYLDRFMVRTVFLGVIDSSAKLHDSIYAILCDLCKNYGINRWVNKVVYIMTDKSDSHMWLEGLINLIRGMSPQNFFAEVKYLSHKIKYCTNVVQKHKATSTFDALLWSIYCYYERVDKGKKNLIHMNKELDEIIECYGSLPKNSYTTLYYEALKAVEGDYASLVRLLESEQLLLHFDFKVRKSGARILSVITRCSFICKLALFIDIFSCLNDFAVKLSSEDLLPYDVHILLDEVCADIEKAADGEGSTSAEIAEELSATPAFFRGIEIVEDSTVHYILPEIKKFSQDLISYLKSLVDDDSLLEKCFIFNICMWPEDDEIANFGNDEFADIFRKFNGAEKHVESALAEWNIFKSRVLILFPFEVRRNSKSVISKMVTDYEDQFPFVTLVLKKILLLNFECSEIKRGYHEMCLNKSFSRSMLSLQSLQTSMMVSMYGPSLSEFDFSPALELFLNSRHRKFRKKIIDKKLTVNYSSDLDDDTSIA